MLVVIAIAIVVLLLVVYLATKEEDEPIIEEPFIEIHFNRVSKTINISNEDGRQISISYKVYIAINQQMKELGWLKGDE